MSNRRRLKPPPTGYSFEKFQRLVLESDLSYAEKQDLLIQARKADKKGKIHGPDPQVRLLHDRDEAAEDVQPQRVAG